MATFLLATILYRQEAYRVTVKRILTIDTTSKFTSVQDPDIVCHLENPTRCLEVNSFSGVVSC